MMFAPQRVPARSGPSFEIRSLKIVSMKTTNCGYAVFFSIEKSRVDLVTIHKASDWCAFLLKNNNSKKPALLELIFEDD